MKEESILKELGFENVNQLGFIVWVKVYKKFTLFISRNPEMDQWCACIRIGKLEINIPDTVDMEWISSFEIENNHNG